MESQAMRDYIRSFSLDNGPRGNQGYSRVLLQLFGYTGHGKSSFINSCKYVLDDGPYTVYAKVAGSAHNPETMIRKPYELTDTVTLVDNRGCVRMDKDETGAIYAQLGNFLPLNSAVKWHSEFKDMLDILLRADIVDQSDNFIVPVLINSAKKKILSAEESELQEIIIKAQTITGLFPAVVITNKLSKHLSDTQEKFRMMGVENMFPVENYTREDNLRTRGKHEGMLKCLSEIIKDVEFRMKETRDPISEKIKRKRILFEFAHNRDIERALERENRERVRGEEPERPESEYMERMRREELARREREPRIRELIDRLESDSFRPIIPRSETAAELRRELNLNRPSPCRMQ